MRGARQERQFVEEVPLQVAQVEGVKGVTEEGEEAEEKQESQDDVCELRKVPPGQEATQACSEETRK